MEIPSDRLLRGLVLLLGAGSLACASVGRVGEDIHIAEESAIIVWDAATKTQHFIRRASFETKAKDFGFLVPTPTQPKLAEASDEAFVHLRRLAAEPFAHLKSSARAMGKKKSEVKVLEQVVVAGLDAAVLSATDATALERWLKHNGYVSTPELMAWAKPYIEKQWIITAFKIAAGAAAQGKIDSTAVRMSFQAEQPFFPYREPSSALGTVQGKRLLRVYFLSDARMQGKVGSVEDWAAHTNFAGPIHEKAHGELAKHLNLEDGLPSGTRHLTEFIDTSSPRRNREDIVFSVSTDQSRVPDPSSIAATEKSLNETLVAAREEQFRQERIGYLAGIALMLCVAVFAFARYRKRTKRK